VFVNISQGASRYRAKIVRGFLKQHRHRANPDWRFQVTCGFYVATGRGRESRQVVPGIPDVDTFCAWQPRCFFEGAHRLDCTAMILLTDGRPIIGNFNCKTSIKL
jgi:hypothetical protein